MIKVAISGCAGRMGSRILELAKKDKRFNVSVLLERSAHPAVGSQIKDVTVTDNPEYIKEADVLIEFTTPTATVEHIQVAARYQKKAVIGTTGLSPEQKDIIKEAGKRIPIVFSPNMSLGINLLFRFSGDVARVLGSDYDIEIVESHHRYKKDAPSGTARRLAEILSDASGRNIPVHSLRVGDVVGEHSIVFAGNCETIEIIHRANSRDVFALGALKAAEFITKKSQGLYDMQDVLKQGL